MLNHSTIIAKNPSSGDCKPKNVTDHKKFSINCSKNTYKNLVLVFLIKPFFQIKKNEIPINAYNVVHTGPKTQLGGEKKGLFKVAYQVGIASAVKIDPRIPAASHRRIAQDNLRKLVITISMRYITILNN